MVRNLLLAALAQLVLATPGSAQEWAEKIFETTRHDFGTIARGAKAEYEFVLNNTYMSDIHVASAQPNCGCTSVRIKNPTLKTYQKGAIVASINSGSFLGDQGATITVTIDKPAHAQVQLHIRVHIQPDVVVEPGVVQLGDVDQGTGAQRTVLVTCTRRSDWKIVDVKGGPHFTGKVVETERRGNHVSYKLHVCLDRAAPSGYINDHLVLVTNDRRSEQIPVMVQGRVLSAITVSPASLFLGVVQSGQKVTKQFVVRGRKPFRIIALTTDCDCFEFSSSPDEAPKPLHLVPVTFVAGEKTGKVAKTIRIETDLQAEAAELPVYAVVTPK